MRDVREQKLGGAGDGERYDTTCARLMALCAANTAPIRVPLRQKDTTIVEIEVCSPAPACRARQKQTEWRCSPDGEDGAGLALKKGRHRA